MENEQLNFCSICGDYKECVVKVKYRGKAYRFYCEDCIRKQKWMYHDYMQKFAVEEAGGSL